MITNATTHTAADLHARLNDLVLERAAAASAGLDSNEVYLHDLESELAATEAAYVGLAVTEIATLRAELGDARYG